MAEIKPLVLKINGVDTVIKSLSVVQGELKELQNAASKTNQSLSSIDKGVKFANFKAAMKSISGELINIATTAVTSGKSTADTVKDVGNSVAGIASNFGMVGAAVGAAITLLTPFVAELFELSTTQKLVKESADEMQKALFENDAKLRTYYGTLKTASLTESEFKKVRDEIVNQFPEYFEGIDTERLTKEQLLLIENDLIRSSRELIKQKAKEGLQIKILTEIYNKEFRLQQLIKNQRLTGGVGSSITTGFKDLIGVGETINNVTDDIKELNDQLKALEETASGDEIEGYFKRGQNALSGFLKSTLPKSSSSGGGGSGQKFTFQNIFGSDFDEIADSAKKVLGDLTFVESDVKKNMAKLRKLAEDEFNQATDKNAEAAKKFIEEDKRLRAELAKANAELVSIEDEVIANQAEINKAYSDLFEGKITGTFTKAAQEEIDRVRNLYKSGALSLEQAASELINFRGGGINISKSVEINKQIQQLKDDADKLQKAKDKINDDIRKNDIKAQQSVDTGALQTYNTRLKTVNEIEKQLFEATEKRNKALAKRNIDAADELNKELLKKGLLDYEAFIQAEKDAADKSLKEHIASDDTKLVVSTITDFNDKIKDELKTTKDLFTFDDKTGLFTITDELLALEVANNPKLKAAYEQNLLATELNNKKVFEIERDLQERLRKRADIFSKEVGAAVNEDYEFEIQSLRDKNGELIKEEKDYFDKVLAAKQEYNKRRRKAGVKQTSEEKKDLETFLNDSLITLKDSYDKQLEIDLFLIDKQIERLKLLTENSTDPAILKQIEDFEKKKLQIIENTTDAYEKEAKRRTDSTNDLNDDSLPDPNKIKQQVTAIITSLQGFANGVLDLINQNSQNIIDNLNEQLDTVEDRTADTLSRIASLEDDLEGKRSGRREAVLQALEQQRELEKQLANEKIALQQKIEKEEIKIRKREKAAAIANALINGAIAQTNIWATVPKVDFGVSTFVLSGIAAATTAAQVALIASQPFAEGGFTGDGFHQDSTGHKVAGVVHNDEWVAPKWMVESPKFAPLISQLEGVRQRGFADGGFTSPDYNSLSQSVTDGNNRRLEMMVKDYFDASMRLADRPIYTKATEVQTVANRSNQRRMSNSI